MLGEAGGVERSTLLEVVNASAVGSPLTGYKGEALVRDDYSATFTTAMMLKDVDLVLDLAEERRLSLPFTRHLRQLLEHTVEGGHADEDFMALYLRLREAAAGKTTSTGAAERR